MSYCTKNDYNYAPLYIVSSDFDLGEAEIGMYRKSRISTQLNTKLKDIFIKTYLCTNKCGEAFPMNYVTKAATLSMYDEKFVRKYATKLKGYTCV